MNLRRPNILLMTSDQQHWNTLSCLGSPVRTPHLDRLAAGGTLFERAYCPNPTCTPTRATMITGLMPSQHGAWSLGTRLDERLPTLGGLLADRAGYRTALIGKAHFQPLRATPEHPSLESYPIMQDLDFWRGFRERFYGFDRVELARNHVDEAHIGQHYALWLEQQGAADWRKWFRAPTGTRQDHDRSWPIPAELHQNSWIAERSCALLDDCARDRDRPFLLWSSWFDPHPPYSVSEPWASLYDPAAIAVPAANPGEHDANPPHFRLTQQESPDFAYLQEPGGNWVHGSHSHLRARDELARDIACYYGMMSFVDQAVGRVLDRLEALGLAEDTIVVFTTDHGHFFGQHGLTAKGPFHYEDMLRIPFIARWPGRIAAGERSRALQSLVDLAPTLLDCAGAEVPLSMSGLSQRRAWCGEAPPVRDHVLIENRHQPTTMHLQTLVEERWKITAYRNQSYGELFDLAADPGEVRNRWDDPAAAADKARLLLRLAQANMAKEPLYMPRIWGA
jgi:uncharacterized sulfatase